MLIEQLKALNVSIFKLFNSFFGQAYFTKTLTILNTIGEPHLVHYHLLAIFVIAGILFYIKMDDHNALKRLCILGVASMITLAASLSIGLLTFVDLLKHHTSVSRPYCSLEGINILPQTLTTSCARSFPSGHIAFATIMIASFWPLLSRPFKMLALFFISSLMISRMASGAHYPSDIMGAVLICLPLTLYIRERATKIVKHCDSRWNIFDRLFKRS